MNTEITVKSEKVFEGKIINLRVDTVELQNQKYAKREIVEHKNAACILAIDNESKIVLVRQYRKAVEEFIYELPAGILNIAEEPHEGALRELEEETGYRASSIKLIYSFYSSPGFTNEKVYLFEARDLIYKSVKFDEDECIESIKVSKDEAKKMLETGRITDSKTIIGLLHWFHS